MDGKFNSTHTWYASINFFVAVVQFPKRLIRGMTGKEKGGKFIL
jgi:hypothetical protein